MTTSNNILAKVIDSVNFVPLESLHSYRDSITYVFKSQGIGVVKQEVQVGDKNADDAVVLLGLEKGDKVYLSIPKGMDDVEIELLPELEGKRNLKKEESVEDKSRNDDLRQRREARFGGGGPSE